MGQLKTGIANLVKVLNETGPKIDSLSEAFTASSAKVTDLGLKCYEGYDHLYLYLVAKFKKAGTTPDAQKAKKLAEIMDTEIASTIKGIYQWKQDLKAKIDDLNKSLTATSGPILASLNQATTQAAQLRALVEKRKAKLLKTPKYKEKLKTYLSSLDEIDTAIKKQTKTASSPPSKLKNDYVDKAFKISGDMTVGDVEAMKSMNLDSVLASYNNNKAEHDRYVRQWRDEFKAIPGQLATMKKWADEADAMDADGT